LTTVKTYAIISSKPRTEYLCGFIADYEDVPADCRTENGDISLDEVEDGF
jgi:hypothetical protein